MRRSAVVAMAVVGVLLLGATIVTYSKYRKSVADYEQAAADQETMRSRYDRAVSEIVAIQDSLSAIVLGEDATRIAQAQAEDQIRTPGTIHDQVLSRIAMLKAAVERTKDRIEQLDTRLKKSGVKIEGLERMIAGLRRSVTEKEDRIAALSTQVDTLEVQVAGLSSEVEAREQEVLAKQVELEAKQRELATVFYAVGSKKELTTAGVVEAKGGVLGLGKTLEPTGRFSESLFMTLDTDRENVIRIPAEKARVLSAQPVTSYEIRPISEDAAELRILDPEAFRKIKHVVILTT